MNQKACNDNPSKLPNTKREEVVFIFCEHLSQYIYETDKILRIIYK